VRGLEQRQNAKGKRRAGSEDDLRVSELPKAFQDANELALRVLAKSSTGEHNPHRQQWSELRHKARSQSHCPLPCYTDTSHAQTEELHALVNTAVVAANVMEANVDRRFANLSLDLHARTQGTTRPGGQPTPALSTYLPQRPADPSEARDLFRALARVDASRPPAQVGVAASRAAREVLRAQDAPASERRITPVAPPTPRTPRRPGTPGRGR
jgi:kinetochore protein Mis13/DSN1